MAKYKEDLNAYIIEDNIPIPNSKYGSKTTLLQNLKEGQSFKFPNSERTTFSSIAGTLKRRNPEFYYRIVKVDDEYCRFFRLKKDD